jgi:hypothetical protein
MKSLDEYLAEVTNYDPRFPYRPELHAIVIHELTDVFMKDKVWQSFLSQNKETAKMFQLDLLIGS